MRGAAACTTISSLGRLHRGLLRREVQCGLAFLLLKSQFEHGSSEYKGGHSMQ